MDLDDAITFCQNNLQRTSFNIFHDMRKNGELCDVTIKVEKRTFTAHRVVLAAGIPYFRSMFANNSSEIENQETGMEELDSRALGSLIDFAYTSKVDICLENVQALLVASELLQLIAVKDACVEFLSKRLFVNNVIQVHKLANSINNTKLLESCNRYFRKNFEELSKTGEFLDLSSTCLQEIISSDDLDVKKEEVVFEAVMNWVKVSPSERKDLLLELLQEVRLVFIRTAYLIKRVAAEDLIRDSIECRNLVENVKSFHLLPKEEALLLNLKTQPRTTNNFPKGIYAVCFSEYEDKYSVHKCDLKKGTWEKLTSEAVRPDILYYYTVAKSEDIYLFSDTTVDKFNLKTLQWQSMGSGCHYLLSGGSAVLWEHKFYFFGSDLNNKVICYDTQEKKWLKEQTMKSCSLGCAAAALEWSIYVTGGFDSKNAAVRTVMKYDPILNQSRKIDSMLVSRGLHCCTVMKKKLYVCGGRGRRNEFKDFDSAEVYDPSSHQWSLLSSMKTTRALFSLLSYENKIYALGKLYSRNPTDFEIYDAETDEWKVGFPVPVDFRDAVSNA